MKGEEKAATELRSYLKQTVVMMMHFRGASEDRVTMEEFVLKHGQAWPWKSRPADVPKGIPKQCFENAYKLALRRKDLTYVEGYAARIIPFHHAWTVKADGTVVDPTLVDDPKYDAGRAYYGVAFDIDFVRKRRHEQWKSGGVSVLDDYENGWPVLRKDFPFTAVAHPFTQAVHSIRS